MTRDAIGRVIQDGRALNGDYIGDAVIEPLTGSPDELADQLRGFEAAGAAHIQLCVDPITRDSIDWLGDVLAAFHRTR